MASDVVNNLEAYRKCLNNDKYIQHYSSGNLNETKSAFNSPASLSDIQNLCQKKGWALPDQYVEFLLYCNGCYLFRDQFGTGFDLLSHKQMDEYHLNYMPKNWIPICYYVGDYLFIDSDRVDTGKGYLMWHNHEQYFEDPPTIRFEIDFNTWLERLIIAQGSPFWEWKN
ncbi:SMI1/KNR4 family protein [Paenibacillus glucanolyticus]|uniref:SMI1/KNR4 family protein n=1 Tax=Paenibacillus glucanolyticus TaxID=59843 RepID=UPI0036C4C3B4